MYLVITVTFDQSSYSVSEDIEVIQPTLVFSNPSLFNETVEVIYTYVSINGMVNSVYMYMQYVGVYIMFMYYIHACIYTVCTYCMICACTYVCR